MPPNKDPRRRVGAVVHSLAKSVQSHAECKGIFGTRLWDKTYLPGIVAEHKVDRMPSGRIINMLVINYTLPGGNTLQRELPIRLVKYGPVPEQQEAVHHPTIERASTPTIDSEVDSILGDDTEDADDTNSISTQPTQSPVPRLVYRASVNFDDDSSLSSADKEEEEDEDECIPCGPNMSWVHDDNFSRGNINGHVPKRAFHFSDHLRREFFDGSDDQELIPLFDYFLAVYPLEILRQVLISTNQQLFTNGKAVMEIGELVKFIGVVVLTTRFEFCSRQELWSRKQHNKHLPALSFGRTFMTRDRFDDIFSHLRFCDQPSICPANVSSEDYRWILVDGHLNLYNKHRAKTFYPFEVICGDESVVRWSTE